MPVTANAHHTQFWLTPPVRTRSVTRFGVSVENVVATSETPNSHQDSLRPERKNSWRPAPARRATRRPTAMLSAPYSARTVQSRPFSSMGGSPVAEARAEIVRVCPTGDAFANCLPHQLHVRGDRHAAPVIPCRQHAHARRAGDDLSAQRLAQEDLRCQVRAVLLDEGLELLLERRDYLRREAPQVHGHR